MICVPIFAERIDDFWAQAVEVRHALRLVHLWSDQFAFLCSQYPNWVQRIESLIAKSFADRISPPSCACIDRTTALGGWNDRSQS